MTFFSGTDILLYTSLFTVLPQVSELEMRFAATGIDGIV